MKAIAFRPMHSGAHDGYPVFRAGSSRWAALRDANVVEIEARHMEGIVPKEEKAAEYEHRMEAFLTALAPGDWDEIGIFCHGWKTGFQLGPSVGTIGRFARALTNPAVKITLYSCACAGGRLDGEWTPSLVETGDGYLADTLRDELCRHGLTHCRVDSHATVGHAYANPFVRRFEGLGDPTGGIGGSWIVRPDEHLWHAWAHRLATDLDFACTFTQRDASEIRASLGP